MQFAITLRIVLTFFRCRTPLLLAFDWLAGTTEGWQLVDPHAQQNKVIGTKKAIIQFRNNVN